MQSLILKAGARYMLPLLALYSVFLLYEGHDKPGGGFAGGLMAAAALGLCTLAYGVAIARRILRIEPPHLIGCGLLVIAASGLYAFVLGEPFLTGIWTRVPLPIGQSLKLGTPQLFDVGVYLTVLGAILMFLWTLAEE